MNPQLLFNFGWLAYSVYSLYVGARYPVVRRRRRRKRQRQRLAQRTQQTLQEPQERRPHGLSQ